MGAGWEQNSQDIIRCSHSSHATGLLSCFHFLLLFNTSVYYKTQDVCKLSFEFSWKSNRNRVVFFFFKETAFTGNNVGLQGAGFTFTVRYIIHRWCFDRPAIYREQLTFRNKYKLPQTSQTSIFIRKIFSVYKIKNNITTTHKPTTESTFTRIFPLLLLLPSYVSSLNDFKYHTYNDFTPTLLSRNEFLFLEIPLFGARFKHLLDFS